MRSRSRRQRSAWLASSWPDRRAWPRGRAPSSSRAWTWCSAQPAPVPNAGIAGAPQVGATVGEVRQQAPGRKVEHVAASDEQRRGFQQVAEHAELGLLPCPIALEHRLAVSIARLAAMPQDGGGQPGKSGLCLLHRADPQERLDGAGDVPHPGAAVVVVLGRPDPFRKRGGRRRRNCACKRVKQQLERQRAAPHRFPVAALIGQVARPFAPGLVRPVDPRVDGVGLRQDQRLVRRRKQRQHRARPGLRRKPRGHPVIGLGQPLDVAAGAQRRHDAVQVHHVTVRACLAHGLAWPSRRPERTSTVPSRPSTRCASSPHGSRPGGPLLSE